MPSSPVSTTHQAVGRAIREIRETRNLSQEDAAHLCGLDRSYYGYVERGQRNIGLTKLMKIAGTFDVRLSELFARAEAILTAQR